MKNNGLTVIADFDNAIPQAFKLCDKIALFTTGDEPGLAILIPQKKSRNPVTIILKNIYIHATQIDTNSREMKNNYE